MKNIKLTKGFAMKKLLILVALFTTIFSTCHADDVKISNLSAENFLASMRGVLYSDAVQKDFPIAITNLVRGENDLQVEGREFKVYSSFFGKQGAENPDGEVTFYVDNTNCVNSVKITLQDGDNSAIEYASVFVSICNAIGLTEDEAKTLLSGGKSEEQGFYHSEVEQQNKIFFVVTTLDEGITRTLFMAGEK